MRPLAIDTNLLVLLVVGLASKDFLARHKRLREFSVADFDLLSSIVNTHSPIVITPNVWTETSNLARQIAQPARDLVSRVMQEMISRTEEAYVASSSAGRRSEFLRLGLSDAALLELKPNAIPILTSDLDLYLAAQRSGREAVNFNHIREANQD